MENSKTTYLIEYENGRKQKVTVPSEWKVTFGPLAIRGTNSSKPHSQKMPIALRFYEKEKLQKAVFTNVVNFRDMSIEIMEERTNTQHKDGFVSCDGRKKNVSFQATTRQWVNPDEESESFPMLPSDVDIFDLQETDE